MQNSHICGEFNRKLSSIIVSKFKGLSTLTKMTTIKNPENPSRKTLNPPGANPYPQKTHFPKIQLTFPSICNLITSRGIDDHNQPRRDPFCNLIMLRHVFNNGDLLPRVSPIITNRDATPLLTRRTLSFYTPSPSSTSLW